MAFHSNALSGTTIESDYIQNVNKTNISDTLTTYAANLVTHIKGNHPGATLSDIIGGKTIDPLEGFPRQTSLPYQKEILEEWTEIPDQYKHSLQIEHRGIDETFYSCDIYGKRLTIFYNESNEPVLRLDGTDIATGWVTTPGSWNSVNLTIDHPYAANGGTYLDASGRSNIKAGGAGFIMNGWAKTGRAMVERHRKILAENIHAGGDNTSEPVLGQSLAMIGYTWLAESSRINELAHQITDAMPGARVFIINHHAVGVCGQAESPYIDIPLSMTAFAIYGGNTDKAYACYYSLSGHRSAFEWGVIDQLQPYSAVSTVKLIDISNDKSDKIFEATDGGQIYVSTDSGDTWTPKESDRNWCSVAMSADGTKQTAVVDGGKIYVSTDSGDTWTAKESNRQWRSIAMSADGTKQTAVVYLGKIYVSTDSGDTWTTKESNRNWSSVAISADSVPAGPF